MLVIQILSFLFLPLFSFVILIFGGHFLKEKSHFISLPLIGLMLINSIVFLIKSLNNHHLEISKSFEWFTTGAFTVSLGCFIDSVTCIMLVVVSLVSFLVHLYSYMK